MKRRVLAAVPTLAVIFSLAACSGGGSSGTSGSIIATFGGSLTSGTGSIIVQVVDFCTGSALSGATVWLDSDTANATTTGSDGMATLSNVAGSSSSRYVSAGIAGYSLTTVYTTATAVRVALTRVDYSASGATTTISGTVTFPDTAAITAAIYVVDKDEDEMGFSTGTATNSAGTGSYSMTVPTGRAMTLVCAVFDSTGALKNFSSQAVASLTTTATVNFTLSAYQAPALLSSGSITGIGTGFTSGTVSYTGSARCLVNLASTRSYTFVPSSASITDFYVPNSAFDPALAAVAPTAWFEVDATSGSTNQTQALFFTSSYGLSTFPSVTLPSGSVSVSPPSNGSGTKPTVTITSTLTATTGFHVLVFSDSITSNIDKRQWTFFVSGGTSSITVPSVPAALSSEALQSGRSNTVELLGYVASLSDFHNLDMGSIMGATTVSLLSDIENYTP